MKTTQHVLQRFIIVLLVAVLLITSTGFASVPSSPAQQSKCGKWVIQTVNADKEKRITATLINDSSSDNCRGAVTLKNKTSIEWLGGGYMMEVTTLANNANAIISLSAGGTESKFLTPSSPLDVRAIPINPGLPANVSIIADVTSKSLTFDAALFLLKSGLALLPGSSLAACGIGGEGTRDEIITAFLMNNWMDILPGINRGSEVIANSVALTVTGDFLGAKRELLGVLPQFFESIQGTLKKQAGSCAIGLVLEIVKKPAAPVKIAVAFLTWLPVMAWDYYSYDGVPAKAEMTYTPVIEPTPLPPTATPTSTPVPTNTPAPVSSLRGTVTQISNCRYGPDWPYLYKYGVGVGTKMEVIGRDADGNWLQVQGIGGQNACWIKSVQIQVDGDVMTLPDTYPNTTGLPISPFFPEISVSVSYSGGMVNVSWPDHEIRSDLSTEQGIEYIVEIWTCVDGKPTFYALGFPPGETNASFEIDNSCGIISHANLIGEDKEGFSPPTIIALP